MKKVSGNQVSMVFHWFANFQVVWLNYIFGWGFWRKVWNRTGCPGDSPIMLPWAAAMLNELTTGSVYFSASRFMKITSRSVIFTHLMKIGLRVWGKCTAYVTHHMPLLLLPTYWGHPYLAVSGLEQLPIANELAISQILLSLNQKMTITKTKFVKTLMSSC